MHVSSLLKIPGSGPARPRFEPETFLIASERSTVRPHETLRNCSRGIWAFCEVSCDEVKVKGKATR